VVSLSFLGKVGAGCRRLLGKVGANRRHSWGEYFLYVPVQEPVAGSGFRWICEYLTKRRRAYGWKKTYRWLNGSGRSKKRRGLRNVPADFLLNLEAFLVYPVQLELSWPLRLHKIVERNTT
jgi:hypothetical protein